LYFILLWVIFGYNIYSYNVSREPKKLHRFIFALSSIKPQPILNILTH